MEMNHIPPKQDAFLQLAAERYSCRAFSDAPVTDTELASLLEAARLAPSAVNRQPVHVWVFKTPEVLEKLKEVTAYTFDAPIVILVACKAEDAWVRKYDGKNSAETDAAIAGTHIMMEAASLGLGCTWVASFDPSKLKELFPQIDEWEPVALFPTGHHAPGAAHSERHACGKPLEMLVSEL